MFRTLLQLEQGLLIKMFMMTIQINFFMKLEHTATAYVILLNIGFYAGAKYCPECLYGCIILYYILLLYYILHGYKHVFSRLRSSVSIYIFFVTN